MQRVLVCPECGASEPAHGRTIAYCTACESLPEMAEAVTEPVPVLLSDEVPIRLRPVESLMRANRGVTCEVT